MAVLSNPYIAGNPVRGESLFVGRADILRDVLGVLRSPETNAIVLYGQRRIGKTSILFELEEQLAATGTYLPVYFDLHDKSDLSLTDILYRLAQQVSRYLEGTTVERDQFDDEGSYFRGDFLPEAVCLTNKKLVLLFDEFDVLDRPYKGQVGARFLPYLRRWIARSCNVHFVLAMGRRPDELSANMLSTFKRVKTRHVSLMDISESLSIVRQSEQNHTLYWSESGIDRICYWTQGHPYLTQLLCGEVWEAIYDEGPEQPPTARSEDVDLAIEATLEQGANAFQWMWNGLTPAEKVTLAAMAGTGQLTVSRQALRNWLKHRGSGSFRRELEMAPEGLLKRDLLRQADGGYRFAIPLLQRWIVENKPLGRVRADIRNLGPQAETLYQQGKQSYDLGDLPQAELRVRHALAIYPNHVRSRLLLGRIHLTRNNPAEAVSAIESAYSSDPAAVRPHLVNALLALAESQTDLDEQWQTVNRALRIDPGQPLVREKQAEILRHWAAKAMKDGEYEVALKAYDRLGDVAGASAARSKMRRRDLISRLPGFSRLVTK
jgi:tetratricopeptide (TPR) repeat protein